MKTNKLLAILIAIVLVGIWGYFYMNNGSNSPIQNLSIFNSKNSTFTVDGQTVTLKNGISEIAIPNSSSKIITRYFGNEAYGDLNSDGKDDTAFLITQENGGSGTFFYAVVAYSTPTGYKTTNAFFIGDRIAPQANQINSSAKELYINYAERRPGEPFTTQPSQGATKVLKITPSGVLEGVMK